MTGVLAAAETVSQLGKLFVPAGQAPISMIDPRDVADVGAVTVGSDSSEGRTLTLTGPEALTYREIAHHLSEVVGRPVEHVDVSDDQARSNLLASGMPDWLVTNLVRLFGLVRRGVMSETTDTVRAVTGRPPRRFAQFATDFASAFSAP
jgi:uncharacterized protein YbjT (DUF2867 family)